MSDVIAWLLDWRDPWHWLAYLASALLPAVRRWGREPEPRRGGRLRWLSAHLNREYQHAKTIQSLWREEDETESQAEQIEIMEHRIEGLLAQLRDASFASSRAKIPRPLPPRKRTSASSTGSTGASPSENGS